MKRKISIVGAGAVGATFAYALAHNGSADEIVLIDRDKVKDEVVKKVRKSAYHIIDYKGATNFAIGLALVKIVRAVLRNEHSVLTVSAKLTGEFGINDVCLGVPCVVSGQGIERIVQGQLTDDELAGLQKSAEVLQEAWDSLNKV